MSLRYRSTVARADSYSPTTMAACLRSSNSIRRCSACELSSVARAAATLPWLRLKMGSSMRASATPCKPKALPVKSLVSKFCSRPAFSCRSGTDRRRASSTELFARDAFSFAICMAGLSLSNKLTDCCGSTCGRSASSCPARVPMGSDGSPTMSRRFSHCWRSSRLLNLDCQLCALGLDFSHQHFRRIACSRILQTLRSVQHLRSKFHALLCKREHRLSRQGLEVSHAHRVLHAVTLLFFCESGKSSHRNWPPAARGKACVPARSSARYSRHGVHHCFPGHRQSHLRSIQPSDSATSLPAACGPPTTARWRRPA